MLFALQKFLNVRAVRSASRWFANNIKLADDHLKIKQKLNSGEFPADELKALRQTMPQLIQIFLQKSPPVWPGQNEVLMELGIEGDVLQSMQYQITMFGFDPEIIQKLCIDYYVNGFVRNCRKLVINDGNHSAAYALKAMHDEYYHTISASGISELIKHLKEKRCQAKIVSRPTSTRPEPLKSNFLAGTETLSLNELRDIVKDFHGFDQERVSQICDLLYQTKLSLNVRNSVNLNLFGANPILVLADVYVVLNMLEKQSLEYLKRSVRAKDIFRVSISLKELTPDIGGKNLIASCQFLIAENQCPESVVELRQKLNLPKNCDPEKVQISRLDSVFEVDNILNFDND